MSSCGQKKHKRYAVKRQQLSAPKPFFRLFRHQRFALQIKMFVRRKQRINFLSRTDIRTNLFIMIYLIYLPWALAVRRNTQDTQWNVSACGQKRHTSLVQTSTPNLLLDIRMTVRPNNINIFCWHLSGETMKQQKRFWNRNICAKHPDLPSCELLRSEETHKIPSETWKLALTYTTNECNTNERNERMQMQRTDAKMACPNT